MKGRDTETVLKLRVSLLEWYDENQRDLPWRRSRDPYAIWVSEIMLQQTRVAAVLDRYKAFMERFPTVEALALAPEQEVLALWSGLGYYRRARMLHRAAHAVKSNHGGMVPQTEAELRLLPGIGAYTAAAIASIAFGIPVPVVDGNVERVVCRLQGWDAGASKSKTPFRTRIEAAADELLDRKRPGDFNQAMMELGATVCLAKNPECLSCPLVFACKTRGEHKTRPRPKRVGREAAVALVTRARRRHGSVQHEVLLEQRDESNSVMASLWELPSLKEVEVPADELRMEVRHAIMQVDYSVRVRTIAASDADALTIAAGERRWVPLSEARAMALTGLARKILSRIAASSGVVAVNPAGKVV